MFLLVFSKILAQLSRALSVAEYAVSAAFVVKIGSLSSRDIDGKTRKSYRVAKLNMKQCHTKKATLSIFFMQKRSEK